MSDNRCLTQWRTARSGEPQVAGNRGACEYERTDWHTARDVQQCRVAAFVRSHVRPRESDRVGATVVVDCKIRQSLVPCSQDQALDELGLQHPVAALAWHIVHSVRRQMEFSCNQPQASLGLAGSRQDHCPVLVVVAGNRCSCKS